MKDRIRYFVLPALLIIIAVCGTVPRQQSLFGQNRNPSHPYAVPLATMTNVELEIAMEVLTAVNQERENRGLSSLTWHNGAAQTAYDHSVDMKERDFFGHVNPDGQNVGDRLNADGIGWSYAGENIAIGRMSVEDVMDAWMNSDGHRANILSENYTHLGVGVHNTSENTWWTQNFLRTSGADSDSIDTVDDDSSDTADTPTVVPATPRESIVSFKITFILSPP